MNFDLYEILKKLKVGSLQLNEKNLIINYCVKQALLIINNNNFKFSLPKDLTSQDLANDAISSLFIPDKNYNLPIVNALNNWNEPINDEISAKYFLFKIINNRLEQELAKKLKEFDPFFGKILRSLNYVIEKNNYKKVNWFGISYITPSYLDNILSNPISPEFLDKLPNDFFNNKTDIVIKKIFQYLIDNNEFPAIPINSLISKIKHVNGGFLKIETKNFSNDFLDEIIDINKILNESLKTLENKVETCYLQKGKISFNHANIYKNILNDFTIDLCNGGISDKLYNYYIKYESISINDFYENHHQIIDYLLRSLKNEIKYRLENVNSNK